MPTYDYACAACGHRFELLHGVHAEGPSACPACSGGPVRKAISAPAVLFKGSGWAKVDRRSAASKPEKPGTDEKKPKPAETGSDSGDSTPAPSAGDATPKTDTTATATAASGSD